MARLRRSDRAPEVDPTQVEARWRQLCRAYMAVEPDSPAATIHAAIEAEAGRLTRSGEPVAHRIAALETFIAERGWRVPPNRNGA